MYIIFDYNRTLFDPENNRLYDGVFEVIEELSHNYSLFLFSYNEFGREKFMEDIGIRKFFKNIALIEEKNETNMLQLTHGFPAETTLVVGDSLRDEITIGNKLGYESIWLKKGKYAVETPRNAQEKPKYTIHSLDEIFEILKK
jgi:FMN phosphatase YigB (HAD superfamily)